MMKNKLTKYNHKAFYYIARKTLFIAVFFVCLSAAVAVPTTINVLTTAPSRGLAEGETSEVIESEQEESQDELLSYTSIQQD